tara:strand:- start:964 stop:1173 length:210 start_codon:yes stop_codon:yes gene_type:complete
MSVGSDHRDSKDSNRFLGVVSDPVAEDVDLVSGGLEGGVMSDEMSGDFGIGGREKLAPMATALVFGPIG